MNSLRKITLVFSMLLLSISPAFAVNYYESPLLTSNRDYLFNSCCCKKTIKNGTHQYYACDLIDANVCPGGTELYSNDSSDCPGNLVFTSYQKK